MASMSKNNEGIWNIFPNATVDIIEVESDYLRILNLNLQLNSNAASV